MITTAERDGQPSLKKRLAHRIGLFGLAVSLFVMIGACDNAEKAANELEGLWQSRGYGMVAQVTPYDVRLIEWTPVSCLSTGKYSTNRFLSELKVQQNHQERTLEIRNDGTLSTITLEPLNDGGFDRLCPTGLTPQTDDPELNFEVLWHTFDQHYAFFSERNVDWDAVYAEFRPQIDKETTRRKLGKVLDEILERLRDGHVALYIDDNDVVSVESRSATKILEECREQWGANCYLHDYLEELYASFEKILRTTYLEDRFKTAFDESAIWGQIAKSTGYFRIDSMEGLARGRYSSSDDLAALEPVIDDMLEDLRHLPNMIVDIRLNGGGHDAVALALASRFADTRRVFGSKRAFENGHRTTQQDLIVEPADGPRYQGRVAVLTSGETASAAEVFALAMRSLPQVTLVGEATMGIFSDELSRSLPNGWEFSLSNEIYLAPNDELFEAIGVPPDVFSPFLSLEDHQNGVDSVIEAAIATLTAR
jgi:C-terminal processing protease CtpA/Prc